VIKLLKFVWPYAAFLAALLVLVIIQVAANLELPDYTAKIINEGVIGGNNDLILRNGGLMLLIAFGIIEKLGGRITVQSAVGHGTTFTVYIPAA